MAKEAVRSSERIVERSFDPFNRLRTSFAQDRFSGRNYLAGRRSGGQYRHAGFEWGRSLGQWTRFYPGRWPTPHQPTPHLGHWRCQRRVVNNATGEILGFHVLAPHGDDLLHEAVAAMRDHAQLSASANLFTSIPLWARWSRPPLKLPTNEDEMKWQTDLTRR